MAPPPSLSESRVLDLVTRYRAVDELHPLVADMFSSQEFEGIFQDALKHEQYIISRRSQDLSDNEITLPQKAFAILWGNRADYYAATALWVEEVLGISVVPVEDKSTVLSTVVKAKSYTLDRLQEYQSTHEHSHGQNNCNTGSEDGSLFVYQGTSMNDPLYMAGDYADVKQRSISADDPQLRSFGGDLKLNRLMDVYQVARYDFDATPPKSLDRTKAAKFLRDTIENCQSYLKAQQNISHSDGKPNYHSSAQGPLDPATLDEMQTLLEVTCAIVERGSGGKKRSFDEGWQGDNAVTMKPLPKSEFKGSFKPNRVVKPSVNAVPLPSQKFDKGKLGQYPVTIHNGRGQPTRNTLHGESVSSQALYNGERSSYRQRDYQRSVFRPERSRSLSPHRLQVTSRRQSPRQLAGRRTLIRGRAAFFSSPPSNTYRPRYS